MEKGIGRGAQGAAGGLREQGSDLHGPALRIPKNREVKGCTAYARSCGEHGADRRTAPAALGRLQLMSSPYGHSQPMTILNPSYPSELSGIRAKDDEY